MSLSLAKSWVNATVGVPAARDDALRFLDQAAAEGCEATLIAGPKLVKNGKCFLGRWDGRELVVRELSKTQQQDWSIGHRSLFRQLERVGLPHAKFSSEPLVSLTVSHVERADEHDGWTPLLGTCVVENTAAHSVIRNVALRAEYFRPDLDRQVTHMWYAEADLHSDRTTLQFQFSPLLCDNNPHICHGTLVVYVQLFTADDWSKPIDCRRISNVADTIIRLR